MIEGERCCWAAAAPCWTAIARGWSAPGEAILFQHLNRATLTLSAQPIRAPTRYRPATMNLLSIPKEEWTHTFSLPSHFTVTETAELTRATIAGLPLPLREEFQTPQDAFGGKSFVRFNRWPLARLQVMGRVARLRSDEVLLDPTSPIDSFWLPDHCIVGASSLERAAMRRKMPSSSKSLRGVGAKSVEAA